MRETDVDARALILRVVYYERAISRETRTELSWEARVLEGVKRCPLRGGSTWSDKWRWMAVTVRASNERYSSTVAVGGRRA